MFVKAYIAVVLATSAFLGGCVDDFGTLERPENAPAYEIFARQDVSFGGTVRETINVAVAATLSQTDVLLVAQAVVHDVASSKDVNALSMHFFRVEQTDDTAANKARVTWAPNGNWVNADSVDAGDYRTHEFKIEEFREYVPSESWYLNLEIVNGHSSRVEVSYIRIEHETDYVGWYEPDLDVPPGTHQYELRWDDSSLNYSLRLQAYDADSGDAVTSRHDIEFCNSNHEPMALTWSVNPDGTSNPQWQGSEPAAKCD